MVLLSTPYSANPYYKPERREGMSLSTAFVLLLAEIAIIMALVVTTRSRALRARRAIRATAVFAALSTLWTIGLAGADELAVHSRGTTWIALLLCVINAVAFVSAHSAHERMQYGSAPIS